MSQKIILVGAGLTGSLMAIYLAKRGFQVDIYERRPDMRKVNISAGRSINLAISARGIHALQQVGLADKLLESAIPMRGRMMHDVQGNLTFQPYGKNDNEYINSISRKELNIQLMNEAEKHPSVKIHFNKRCTGMNLTKTEVHFCDENTGENTILSCSTVIGTDGAASALRMEFLKHGHFNFSQHYENYGYKELTLPAAAKGAFRIEKNALHIWPRGAYMMIALPNVDGDFTCTLFLPYSTGEYNFDTLKTRDDVLSFFEKVMPDAIEHMPGLLDDFFNHPTGSLLTVKCAPWNYDGNLLLMGDAAHAIVPFFGQGMNCGFEDCYYLDQLIAEHGSDWKTVFTRFSKLREANASAIADMALENFVEMRDLVAHKDFLLKKKADVLLEEKYPGLFISKYSMVSFHRIPYAVAQQRGKIQDTILMEMCSRISSIEELDLGLAWKKISAAFAEAGIEEKIVEEV